MRLKCANSVHSNFDSQPTAAAFAQATQYTYYVIYLHIRKLTAVDFQSFIIYRV